MPYALPGEHVRVRIIEQHKKFARGELVEILQPAAERVNPPCRHFGVCGGCQWQHAAYPAQLAFKRHILQGQLEHLGALREVSVAPVLGMETPWNWRNHVQFAADAEGNLGFLAARSHQIVPIEECYLLHPYLEDILVSLDLELPTLKRLSLRAGANTGDLMVIIETGDDEPPELDAELAASFVWMAPDGSPVTLVGRDYIEEEIAGRRYRLSANSFFQVNTEQAEHLVRLVGEALAPEGTETLLDLYCGVGVFGLALAERVQQVIGIEENLYAIEDAEANAQALGNVRLFAGRVEEILPDLPDAVQLVVVDPPRSGIEPAALQALIQLAPRRIAYVSCDPASLARDLKTLAVSGYVARHVQPVDMFPQTYHIESITLLER